MSYDARLAYGDETARVPLHSEGGTYALGGSYCAELNVTYNYGPILDAHLTGGLRGLNGEFACHTIFELGNAVIALGVVRDPDYWACTEGNVGHALNVLLGWARLHPDAVWEVT